MYRDLNFININQLLFYIKKKKLNFKLNKKVLESYFLRVKKDKEFIRRHYFLSFVIRFFKIRNSQAFKIFTQTVSAYYSFRD